MRDFTDQQAVVYCGDNIEILRGMADNSVDSIVTDPPYGLSFMGKKWDYDVPSVELWQECLRVMKPGGHLLAFAGTRTQHRMCVRIEDAGFEIRDMIAWVYGSGFPKSKNVALSIDKGEGFPDRGHRMAHASRHHPDGTLEPNGESLPPYEGRTEKSQQWEGWGTALKPALEPITLARKPLVGTVAENVLTHGTGALNIDGCRVGTHDNLARVQGTMPQPMDWGNKSSAEFKFMTAGSPLGRWPANLIHDGSDEVVAGFPIVKTGGSGETKTTKTFGVFENGLKKRVGGQQAPFQGSAARFFYCAKASKRDRDEGLDGFELRKGGAMSGAETRPDRPTNHPLRANIHPTVKPTDLMRYLCRLVTPPNGIVLDPFTGSGSTGKAVVLEGFRFIGIERDAEYVDIARARIAAALRASEG